MDDEALSSEVARLRSDALALRREGQAIAAQVAEPPRAQRTAGDALVEGFVSRGARKISKDFFGTTRHGSNFARDMIANSKTQQLADARAAQRAQADAFVDRVGALAERAAAHLTKASRASLLGGIASAREAAKPGTAVRRAIAVVQRIENLERDPQGGPATPKGADYEALERLENALRAAISGRLSAVDSQWWQNLIPDRSRKTAERRHATNDQQWPWTPGPASTPLEFLDFPEYAEIICSEPNWSSSFKAVFVDGEILRAKLRELQPIRRAIAHARTLTQAQSTKLHLYSAELVGAVSRIP